MKTLYVLVAVLWLFMSCSTNKAVDNSETKTEREKEIKTERIVIKEREIIRIENTPIILNNPESQTRNQNTNLIRTVRLWIKIVDGEIVENYVLSGDPNLKKDRIEINGQETRLYLRSKNDNSIYAFNIPQKDGEYEITGRRISNH